MAVATQTTLFGLAEPSFEASRCPDERVQLPGGAWFDYQPGWLRGDQALFDQLASTVEWRAERRLMYDRVVDVPRLTASLPRCGPMPSVVRDIGRWLSQTYGEPFGKIGLAWYRDGSDSVAPHGDQIARDLDTSIMATVSLGSPRRFSVSPAEGGSGSMALDLGAGDLLVMGGTIRRTWRHGVPKTSRSVGPRMCVMFRPPWLG